MNQPRKDFGSGLDHKRLMQSVARNGIQQPIVVTSNKDGIFTIIDGHRRYMVAQELNIDVVPVLIYPSMTEGELESRRFELQNNRREWKPLERSQSLTNIKKAYGFSTNKDLAQHIGLSTTVV